MKKYPGKEIAEAALVVPSRALATKIVQGRLIDAVGWWWLRQTNTRGELVDKGVCSRAASYRQEEAFLKLMGKKVEDVSNKELRDWVGRIGSE